MTVQNKNQSGNNGEFKGSVKTDIAHIKKTLDDIWAALGDINKLLTPIQIRNASLRTQVRVLWVAAGVYGLTLLGLTLKVILTGGVS